MGFFTHFCWSCNKMDSQIAYFKGYATRRYWRYLEIGNTQLQDYAAQLGCEERDRLGDEENHGLPFSWKIEFCICLWTWQHLTCFEGDINYCENGEGKDFPPRQNQEWIFPYFAWGVQYWQRWTIPWWSQRWQQLWRQCRRRPGKPWWGGGICEGDSWQLGRRLWPRYFATRP